MWAWVRNEHTGIQGICTRVLWNTYAPTTPHASVMIDFTVLYRRSNTNDKIVPRARVKTLKNISYCREWETQNKFWLALLNFYPCISIVPMTEYLRTQVVKSLSSIFEIFFYHQQRCVEDIRVFIYILYIVLYISSTTTKNDASKITITKHIGQRHDQQINRTCRWPMTPQVFCPESPHGSARRRPEALMNEWRNIYRPFERIRCASNNFM